MRQEKPWYVEWFDENYLEVYKHRNTDDALHQVELILNTLKLSNRASILDLGCGEGRYTEIFKNEGYQVVGLDLSKVLIQYGKKRNPHLNLVVGDMRFIPGRFDLILSLFTSFGYFEKDLENYAVIKSVYQSLFEGGIFWMDFLNLCYVRKHLVPESITHLSSGIQVIEKRKILDNRIVKDIYFRRNNTEKCYKESVRLFSIEELKEMFLKTGFRLLECFGDYQGNSWTKESERMILVGRK